jgi:hypothetical protein
MKSASMVIALMLMPPPPPAPDPARLAEAVSIWRDHPLDARQLAEHARFAIRDRIAIILRAARVRPGGRQWLAKYRLLEDYFWTRISQGLQGNETPFVECLARRYAWMSVDEIRALRDFLATPAGARFWDASAFSDRDSFTCALSVFSDDISGVEGGAWDLIGARRPPPAPAMD